MAWIINLLTVGSVFTIGFVLVNGLDGDYEFLGWGMPGWRILLVGLAGLGGSTAARFIRSNQPTDPLDPTRPIEAAYRPGMIAASSLLLLAGGLLLITSSSKTLADDLAVGDCFDDPETAELVLIDTVACDEPHDNEVFAINSVGVALGFSFPTPSEMEEFAFFACVQDFDSFVGTGYQDSILDMTWLYPTSESWADGDRIITCALYRLDLQQMTGSMRGSGL